MDHFERQLAQMMRSTREHSPFEPRHRERLRAGVRVRRRVRAAQQAIGSVVAVAGIALGVFLFPGTPVRSEPGSPRPLTATSTSLSTGPSPAPTRDRTPTAQTSMSVRGPDRSDSSLPAATAPPSSSPSGLATLDPSRITSGADAR